MEPPKSSPPSPGGQLSRLTPGTAFSGHCIFVLSPWNSWARKKPSPVNRYHSPQLPFIAQIAPAPGTCAAPTDPKQPRRSPSSGPGAKCEPWTPLKVLGYVQRFLPFDASKQLIQLSLHSSTKRLSSEGWPTAGAFCAWAKS